MAADQPPAADSVRSGGSVGTAAVSPGGRGMAGDGAATYAAILSEMKADATYLFSPLTAHVVLATATRVTHDAAIALALRAAVMATAPAAAAAQPPPRVPASGPP